MNPGVRFCELPVRSFHYTGSQPMRPHTCAEGQRGTGTPKEAFITEGGFVGLGESAHDSHSSRRSQIVPHMSIDGIEARSANSLFLHLGVIELSFGQDEDVQ